MFPILKLIETHVLTYQSALKMHAGCDCNTPGLPKPLKVLIVDGIGNIYNNFQNTSKINLASNS